MDFLKTLLLYMTVTMATSVQNGPLPEDVPTPAITPPAQVEPAPEAEGISGLQVEMPEAVTPAVPTAEPNPTITPNKHYTNIEFGDRGNNVKKMQERLIELGYLPEGSADGAFGYQTNRALREFQEKNGLNKDGVAGPATLTRLYEDPDVVALPTATPEPTNTPEPEAETALTLAPPEETEGALAPGLVLVSVPLPETTEAPEEEEAPAEDAAQSLTLVDNASIVLGQSGSRLAALRLSDGVMVSFSPRLWLNAEGIAVVSLRDMADCVNAWMLQIEDNVYTLEAAGYTVVLTVTEEGVTCAVDGEALELKQGDVLVEEEDLYVTADFLRQALGAEALWDADETTLMLNIPEKEAAQAND